MTGYHMTVIIGPAPNFGIQHLDQIHQVFAVGWVLMISLMLARNAETFFLAGIISALALVFAYIKNFKEMQSHRRYETTVSSRGDSSNPLTNRNCTMARFNATFEYFPRVASDDKSSAYLNYINALCTFGDGLGTDVFQAVQCHIRQCRRRDPTLWRTFTGRKPYVRLSVRNNLI